MFTQIGSILPQLRDYERLFESHARLALAITAIYVDILEFCADAKSVFRTTKRPSSKDFASTIHFRSRLLGLLLTSSSDKFAGLLKVQLETVQGSFQENLGFLQRTPKSSRERSEHLTYDRGQACPRACSRR